MADAPALSNFLSSLAVDVAGDVAAYRRGSLEAHRAYLSAGAKLVQARGECRRGQWGPFLEKAGLDARTARDMMSLARADVTAERMTDLGGVRAALEALRLSAAVALEAAADEADRHDGAGEKTATVAGIEGQGEPDEGRVKRDVEDDAAAVRRVLDRDRHPSASSPARTVIDELPPLSSHDDDDGEPTLTPAQLRRLAKRERGECLDCETATDGEHVRCARCRARIAAADKRRREDARLGSVLGVRIRDAARRGRGVRLTAADVAGLVEGERERFRERLAGVRGSPKGR